MQTIENSLLQVSVDESGAQMTHLVAKTHNYDFLQDKDQQENIAIAFPAIVSTKDLALDLPWTVVDKGDARVSLTMIDTPKSYKEFPYHFEAMVTYVLEGNQVRIEFLVQNNSNKEMPFSLGMTVPLLKGWQAKTDNNKVVLTGPDEHSGTLESTDFKLKIGKTITCLTDGIKLAGENSRHFHLNLTIA